jgi:long-chain acyl-CoA synthetase
MLSIMPIFHGFGFGIGIHTFLIIGGCCHLVPQFSVDTYANLLKTVQPNYIAGVPTLFEALLRNKRMEGVDLSCLIGVFSGGDTLSVELKKKVDAFLRDHGAQVQLREGYGLTECVTASCLTPKDFYKEGSIGIPFPDTYYKIVKASTKIEVPYGDEGEICISGPTVMIGYLNSPSETESTLQMHEDGRLWLHTGDLGVMDSEGFIHFKQRLKRMIISSGYSIYPSQLENIIDGHEAVLMSSVIGVPDPYKMQKVKAFVVLKPDVALTDELRESIYQHCNRNIAHYAMPYEFEYMERLPQTLVGKVAYTVLEAQEVAKIQASMGN